MIIDFKSNLVLLIMSLILAAVLGVYLVNNAEGTDVFTLVVLGLIYLVITWMQLRRNTQRMVQQLEMVLMIQLNVKDYRTVYEKMVFHGSKYSPLWNVTKRERLAIAYLIEGKYKDAQSLVDALEDHYHVFLESDPYSAYLLSVIKTLHAFLNASETEAFKALKEEAKAFERLPEKVQSQLNDNPSGFHRVFHELKDHFKTDDVTWFNEKTPFIKSVIELIYNQQKKADFKSAFIFETSA